MPHCWKSHALAHIYPKYTHALSSRHMSIALCTKIDQPLVVYNLVTLFIASTAMSQFIESHVLSGTNPCIYKTAHVQLMQIFLTLRLFIT